MNNTVLTTFTEISVNIRKNIYLKLTSMNQKSYLKMPKKKKITKRKGVLIANFNIITYSGKMGGGGEWRKRKKDGDKVKTED